MSDGEKKQKVKRIQKPKTTSVDHSDEEKYDYYDFTGIENLEYSLFKKLNTFREAASKASASNEFITCNITSSGDKGNHFDEQKVAGTDNSSLNGEIQQNKENGILDDVLNSGSEDIEDKDVGKKSDLPIKSGFEIDLLNHFDNQKVSRTCKSYVNGEIEQNKENGILDDFLNSRREDIEDKDAGTKSDLQTKSGLGIESSESLKSSRNELKDELDELLETSTDTGRKWNFEIVFFEGAISFVVLSSLQAVGKFNFESFLS